VPSLMSNRDWLLWVSKEKMLGRITGASSSFCCPMARECKAEFWHSTTPRYHPSLHSTHDETVPGVLWIDASRAALNTKTGAEVWDVETGKREIMPEKAPDFKNLVPAVASPDASFCCAAKRASGLEFGVRASCFLKLKAGSECVMARAALRSPGAATARNLSR